jgi:hypothetical protein
MKTRLLLSTLAASLLFTVPAGARGGGNPGQMMPSYPHDSYCAWCFPYPEGVAQPRIIVRRPLVRRHIRG